MERGGFTAGSGGGGTGLSSRQSTAAVTPIADDIHGMGSALMEHMASIEASESVNRRALEDTALTAAAGFLTRCTREARDHRDAAAATAEQGEHRRMIVNLESQGRVDVELSERSERILCRRGFDRTRRGLVELRDLADDEVDARRLFLAVEARAWDATKTAFTAEREDLALRQTLLPGPWARRQRVLRSAEKEEAAHRAVMIRSEAAEYAYLAGRESRDVIHLLDHDDAARESRMAATSGSLLMAEVGGSVIAQHYRDAALPDAMANDLFTSAVVNQRAAFCDHLVTTTALYHEFVRAVCWQKPSYFLTPELAAYSGRHFERSFAVRASAVARVASHDNPHIQATAPSFTESARMGNCTPTEDPAPPPRVGWRDWLRGDGSASASASTVAPSASTRGLPAEHDGRAASPSRLKPIPRLSAESSPRRRVDFSMGRRSTSGGGDGIGSAGPDDHGHALQVHHERLASTKPVALCLMTPPVNGEAGRAKDREAASFVGTVADGAHVPKIHDNAVAPLAGFDRAAARYVAVARDAMEAKALAILPGGHTFGSARTRRSARTGVLAASVRFDFDAERTGGVAHDRAVVALGVSAQDGAAFFGWRSDGALTTDMQRASPLRSYGAGSGFAPGDIVTVMLDFNELTLSFAVNGDACGAAFEFSAVDDPEPLFSTVLLCAGAKAELV
jgi:hypothetical protein